VDDSSATRLSLKDPVGFPSHSREWFSIIGYQKFDDVNSAKSLAQTGWSVKGLMLNQCRNYMIFIDKKRIDTAIRTICLACTKIQKQKQRRL
jgi:hypothetical protein